MRKNLNKSLNAKKQCTKIKEIEKSLNNNITEFALFKKITEFRLNISNMTKKTSLFMSYQKAARIE